MNSDAPDLHADQVHNPPSSNPPSLNEATAAQASAGHYALAGPKVPDRALELWGEALLHAPPGFPERRSDLVDLAPGLRERYEQTRDPADLERAIRDEAWFFEAHGLAAHTAYALAKRRDLPAAVRALEQGRARLLAEALERDWADLERLRQLGHVDLYERYRRAIDHWHDLARLTAGLLTGDIEATRAELDAAIAAIRQVHGYERFLEPPSIQPTTWPQPRRIFEGHLSRQWGFCLVSCCARRASANLPHTRRPSGVGDISWRRYSAG